VGELRQDPVSGRWVIIAAERAGRPNDFPAPGLGPGGRPAQCPFCPGNEAHTPPELLRIGDGAGWRVRVVPNRYPALEAAGGGGPGGGLRARQPAVGIHEVVIESPLHESHPATWSEAALAEVLGAYGARLRAAAADPRLAYAVVFKNHGAGSGATLAHPHAQLMATTFLPELPAREVEGARRHAEATRRCIWCDVIRDEREGGLRLVAEGDGLVALAPFAARFPFETWLLPTDHRSRFEDLSPAALVDLASMLSDVLHRLRAVASDPPFNWVLHTAPLGPGAEEGFHWHLELWPVVTRVAGFEWGTGVFVNPVPPEDAARRLRAAGEAPSR
jgi:UDPglucose--hexose-1-phosphate uridylyltransferase